jgi:hypothetical protein
MKTATKTRFSDIVLDDSRLSMAAKGLFLTLGFLGNSATLSQLMRHCADSKEGLERSLGELREVEYVSLEGDTISVKSASSFGLE